MTVLALPRTPGEYLKTSRVVENHWKTIEQRPLRLAVLASFTADFVRPFLVVEANAAGIAVSPWFAPFGQFEQVVLDPTSALWAEPVGAVWLAMRIEDVDPLLVTDFPDLSVVQRTERITSIGDRLLGLVGAVRERTSAPILVSNHALPPTLDVFDANDPDGLVHLVAVENRRIARALVNVHGAQIFDWAGLHAQVGRHFGDPKLWYMARSPVATDSLSILARRLARSLRAAVLPAAKCIVLDLDNTLWGGVLGDDGPERVQLGDAHPGSVFKDFQLALLQLRRRGFLLAIASKNDAQTVDSMLRTHPEMILRPKDFAAIFANWEPKATNLRRIAEQLNIGLDSLVFIDDNPLERAQVSAELPMVVVPELPTDPMRFVSALADVAALDRPRLSQEDRIRTEMYQQDNARNEVARNAPDVATFLASLEMKAVVDRCTPMVLERVHQLIQKTNQFNLTTRRYAIDEVSRLARSPEAAVAWLRFSDRFGDMGLVCVGIVRQMEPAVWEIETFLMSCRVMGKGVEDAFLSYLFELAVAGGARTIRGVFRRTAKNTPVERFYDDRGFRRVAGTADEGIFERDPIAQPYPWPAVIKRTTEEAT
jgi:FkbH-like protein